MEYCAFGRTGIRVSKLALGTGMLGMDANGLSNAALAQEILHAYAEAGGNLINTSDAYQGGRSEEMIGEFLRERRDDMVLVSKYARTADRTPSPARTGNHRKAMMQSVDASLRRLKTDRIDLYFAHLDDGITPVAEIMRGFDDLVTQGKILYAGLSNFSAWRTAQAALLAEMKSWAPLAHIEVEYSLLQRTTEREILPLARDLRLGVLAYSPLAAGLLTGKRETDDPRKASRMGLPTEADVPATLDVLRAVAGEQDASPANVALAWIIAKGALPILGVRNPEQLAENLKSLAVVLSPEQIGRLDAASAVSLGYPGDLQAAFRRMSA